MEFIVAQKKEDDHETENSDVDLGLGGAGFGINRAGFCRLGVGGRFHQL